MTIPASNVGRADAEITSWAFLLPDEKTMWPTMDPGSWEGPNVPLILAAGHAVTWLVLLQSIAGARRVGGYPPDTELRAVVWLGSGKRVVS